MIPVPLGLGRAARRVADEIASLLGGQVEPCRMTFSAGTARHRVRATYGGRRLDVYVFKPWCEVWVQDVRLAFDRLAFTVGQPYVTMGLTEPVAEGFASRDSPRVYSNAAFDWQAIRAFLKVEANEEDLRSLDLRDGEFAMVASRQMILRSRVDDLARLRSRLEGLRRLWERNGRPDQSTAAASGVFALKVLNGVEEAKASGPHRFGGRLEPPVACRSCGNPLNVLVRLDVSDGALGLPPVACGFLPVVYCLACQPAGPTTLACKGGRWLLEKEGPGEFQPPVIELAERPLAVTRVLGAGKGLPPFAPRLGGEPDWLQASETPDCPGCGGLASFLLQLPSDPALEVQFGDDGMCYAFFCPRCVMATSLTQSH